MKTHLIGIDLGGTNLRMRLASWSGEAGGLEELETRRLSLASRDPDGAVATIAAEIGSLAEAHGVRGPLRIAFAVAAMLDPTGEIVKNAPNLGWRDVPLVALLADALANPHSTLLLNDLDAAAYGEFVAGAAQKARHAACVFVGTGVGCGLVLDGQLYTGASRVAGEFGHVKVVWENGRACGCGAHGCLEAYVGGHHLAAIVQEAARGLCSPWLSARAMELRDDPNHATPGYKRLTAADIEAGAAADDPVCLQIWERTAEQLGGSLANLITLLNLDALILGGGVLSNTPLLYKATLQQIQQHANPVAYDAVTIAKPELGDDAGILGAIHWARRR